MICKTCKEDKSLECFPKMQGYYRKTCKLCRASYEKSWRNANSAHKKAYDKAYYHATFDKQKPRRDAYRKSNKERLVELRKRWVLNNPEREVLNRKNCKARRRAVEKTGKVTQQEWQDQLATFNNHCAYCLKPLDKAEMEHMKPLSRGGEHSIDNIVPSCPSCNRLKSTRTLLEFARTSCAA